MALLSDERQDVPEAFRPYEEWAFTYPNPRPQSVEPEAWDRIEGLPNDLRGLVECDILLTLGIGGFALVHEGKLTFNGTSRKVAIKAPFAKVDPHTHKRLVSETAKRIAREVKVMRALCHPNIIHLHGICYDPDVLHMADPFPAMVLSFCDGGKATKYLENHPDTPRMPMILGVAKALEYMHKYHVIHGDLSPNNILVKSTEQGPRAVLSDFGSARIESEGDTSWSAGTRLYLAPEIKDSDPRHVTTMSDAYAFALTSLAVVSGKEPFGDDPNAPHRLQRLGERPSRQDHSCSEMSDALWECISACWVSYPSSRWTMVQVVSAISPSIGQP